MKTFGIILGVVGVVFGLIQQRWDAAAWAAAYLVHVIQYED